MSFESLCENPNGKPHIGTFKDVLDRCFLVNVFNELKKGISKMLPDRCLHDLHKGVFKVVSGRCFQ